MTYDLEITIQSEIIYVVDGIQFDVIDSQMMRWCLHAHAGIERLLCDLLRRDVSLLHCRMRCDEKVFQQFSVSTCCDCRWSAFMYTMTMMLCYQLSSYVANFMCWPVWTLQVVTIECYSCQSSGLSTAHWVATQMFPSYWMKRTKNNEKSKRVGIYRIFDDCSWWLLIVRLRWSMRCDWRFLGSSRVSMLLRYFTLTQEFDARCGAMMQMKIFGTFPRVDAAPMLSLSIVSDLTLQLNAPDSISRVLSQT